MSTRSYIAKEQEDGTFKYVYCHFDGHPDNVGQTLVEHFQDKDKVNKLMNLGDLSFLRPNIDTPNDFDNPNYDVTMAYHRDRGEDLNTRTAKNLEELLAGFKNSWTEYIYIYDIDGEWLIKNDNNDFWNLLADRKAGGMRGLIIGALNKVGVRHLNFESESAKELIADIITKELKERGVYTMWDDRKLWYCKICGGTGKSTYDVE